MWDPERDWWGVGGWTGQVAGRSDGDWRLDWGGAPWADPQGHSLSQAKACGSHPGLAGRVVPLGGFPSCP